MRLSTWTFIRNREEIYKRPPDWCLYPHIWPLSASINQMCHKRMRKTVGLQQANSVSTPLGVYLKGVLIVKPASALLTFCWSKHLLAFSMSLSPSASLQMTFLCCSPNSQPQTLQFFWYIHCLQHCSEEHKEDKHGAGHPITVTPWNISVTTWPEWSSSSCFVPHHQTMEQAEIRDDSWPQAPHFATPHYD